MVPTDRKRFAACLLACSEIYGKAISESVVGVWWSALKAWDIEAVEEGFARHFRSPDNGQFQPEPADIIRMIQGTAVDSAMVAWSKFDQAVRRVGPYASVVFDDPLIQRVAQDMGGWIAFGAKSEDEWPFVGNEFRTRYQGYRSRGETPEYPARLIGIAEAENAQRGIAHCDVVLIGDQQKAKQISASGSTKPGLALTRDVGTVLRLVAAK